MNQARGLSLVEVMIVMAIIALSVGLVGPRIGGGMTRIEVYQAEQTIRSFVEIARSRAQRSNLAHFVVLNRRGPTVTLVGPDMNILRERKLPSSVELVVDSEEGIESIDVPPSGLLRGQLSLASPMEFEGGDSSFVLFAGDNRRLEFVAAYSLIDGAVQGHATREARQGTCSPRRAFR